MPKKQIVKTLKEIAGKYSIYTVFEDWVKCCAISISNALTFQRDDLYQSREKSYLNTIKKYTHDEQIAFTKMFALLVEAMERTPGDILGDIYMEANMGNNATGQVFTPFSLSTACAKLALGSDFDSKEKITLNEPCCGGGGMIIATALELKDKGINYQKRLEVIAQDLDWRCVYMCYVQLSLLGIKALVVQGDTLASPYHPNCTDASNIFITPAKKGLLL